MNKGIDLSLIDPEILNLYSTSRSRVRFFPEDIIDPALRAQEESRPFPASPQLSCR